MSRRYEINAELEALDRQSAGITKKRRALEAELALLLTSLRVGDLCDFHTYGKVYRVMVSYIVIGRYGDDMVDIFYKKLKKNGKLMAHEQRAYLLGATEKFVKIGRYRPPPRVRGAAPVEED